MQKEGICGEGRRPAAGWESVSKIPPRGRRVGGGRLGFQRRREEGVGETGTMAGLVGCGRAAGAPGPPGEGIRCHTCEEHLREGSYRDK